MTSLLEIKEKIKLLYSKGDFIILPIAKFLLAFAVLSTLNNKMGYMAQLDNIAVVLIVSLLCSVLSPGMLLFFATVISLAHMYSLAMEVALVGLCMYLVMYLLFFRFSPKDAVVVVITPLLFAWKMPYIVPLVVGLLCTPVSAVSVGCGVAVHYLTETVVSNAPNIKTMDDEVAKIRLMIEGFLSNRAMVILIVAFGVTILIVYMLRRLAINYAWTIAMVAGAVIEVMVLLIGDLLYETNIGVGGVLLGAVLGVLVCKVVEFFRFCVDYDRTEKVQFEDDEYYYYVKAVPKMSVAMTTKTVKRINPQQVGQSAQAMSGVRTSQGTRPVQAGRTVQNGTRTVTTQRTGSAASRTMPEGNAAAPQRHVTTERTAPSGQRIANRSTDYRGSKSVTIGSASGKSTNSTQEDDYEELF